MRKLGIGVVIAVAFAGCSDKETSTELHPEGPPMIRQVFALELVTEGNISRQATQLAFGTHPDIDETEDDGQVTNAIALGGQRIRVVFDELLRGNAIEEIACADGSFSRVPIGTTPDDIEDCAGPVEAIQNSCTAVCVDPSAGPIGVLDENEDGAADDFRMISGQIRLLCDDQEMALNLQESFYQPSGNQQITAGPLGINSLGPAVVLIPESGLRTSSSCRFEFASDITDKDGNLVCAPPNGDIKQSCASPGDVSLVSFQVEPLRVKGQDPPMDATNIPTSPTVLLQFNANIDPASASAITLEDDNSQPVAATVAVSSSDATLVTMMPDAPLSPNTTYTVVIATTLADAFGGTLPAVYTTSFTTAGGTPTPDASLPDAQVNDAMVFDAMP